MIKFIIKLILKFLILVYPRLLEIFLEQFVLVCFPGKNFKRICNNDILDSTIVFKSLKPMLGQTKKYYIITNYDRELNTIRISFFRREYVDERLVGIDKEIFMDIIKNI